MKPEIILVGGGGHCKSCIDVIEQRNTFRIAGIIDCPEKLHDKLLGYDVIGSDADLLNMTKKFKHFLITIGQISTPQKRRDLFDRIKRHGAKFPVIISPTAYVSPHATIGEGTIVMHQACINAGASIGANCIINSQALIEHDAVVADHCHISTGSILNGNVTIRTGTFLGSGSVCRENIRIGENSFIKLHSQISKNVSSKDTTLKEVQT